MGRGVHGVNPTRTCPQPRVLGPLRRNAPRTRRAISLEAGRCDGGRERDGRLPLSGLGCRTLRDLTALSNAYSSIDTPSPFRSLKFSQINFLGAEKRAGPA